MSSRKCSADSEGNHHKPKYFDICSNCGVCQGKMKNHYQQSPQCCLSTTSRTTQQLSSNTNKETDKSENNSESIYNKNSDNFSGTSLNILNIDHTNIKNYVPINDTINTDLLMIGKEINVPSDDTMYDEFQHKQE